jgi:hypothetical protein
MSSSSSGSGNLTDASAPINTDKKITRLPIYLNRLKKLIVKDGYLERSVFFERRQKLQRAFEKIDELLRVKPNVVYKHVKGYDKHLYKQKNAYQQFIYFVRILKFDKNIWKQVFPSLVFGRLTELQLGEVARWHPPRRRKKRDPKHKTVKTLPYFMAGKKMIEDALSEKQFPKIMNKLRTNIPFGSPLFLKESIHNYNETEERRKKLEREKEKLRYCAWSKIGKGATERMSQQSFCKKNQKFIKQFRHPDLKQKNLKVDELNKMKQ